MQADIGRLDLLALFALGQPGSFFPLFPFSALIQVLVQQVAPALASLRNGFILLDSRYRYVELPGRRPEPACRPGSLLLSFFGLRLCTLLRSCRHRPGFLAPLPFRPGFLSCRRSTLPGLWCPGYSAVCSFAGLGRFLRRRCFYVGISTCIARPRLFDRRSGVSSFAFRFRLFFSLLCFFLLAASAVSAAVFLSFGASFSAPGFRPWTRSA